MQVDAALDAAAYEHEGRPNASDHVQLSTMHHGMELEVTLLRIKEGEKSESE